jgi:hypothetical protein
MCAFELVDKDNRTIDFLIFPINPNNVKESTRSILTVEGTAGGTVTLESSKFQPTQIMISGTFGRNFKFLVGRNVVDAAAINFNKDVKEFSKQIKTGYGVTKVLENMIRVSKTLDKHGNPYKLFFYNTMSNNSFLVKVEDYTMQQSFPQSNMMWEYTIPMIGIAPVNAFTKDDYKHSLSKSSEKSAIMKGLASFSSGLKSYVKSQIAGSSYNDALRNI